MCPKRFKDTAFYQKHQFRPWQGKGWLSLLSALCLLLFLCGDSSGMALKRHALANEIRLTAVITGIQTGVYKIDEQVIRAMARVPRHLYISRPYDGLAYYNVALPVKGQNDIAPEPFVTAMMVHLMAIDKDDNVLEIGFGTGYEAAVLGQLAGTVHSVMQVEPLETGETRPFINMNYSNIETRESSNTLGWPEAGPYDSILVRQSMTAPPLSLFNQLKPGGRLVIPVGSPYEVQRLTVYMRDPGGRIIKHPTLNLKIPPLLAGNEI